MKQNKTNFSGSLWPLGLQSGAFETLRRLVSHLCSFQSRQALTSLAPRACVFPKAVSPHGTDLLLLSVRQCFESRALKSSKAGFKPLLLNRKSSSTGRSRAEHCTPRTTVGKDWLFYNEWRHQGTGKPLLKSPNSMMVYRQGVS